MVNGIFLLGLMLTLGGTVELLKRSRRANPDRTPTPVVTGRARPCDTTGCSYPGWIVARRRDGSTAHVCAGDYADGHLRGWWATDDQDVTR